MIVKTNVEALPEELARQLQDWTNTEVRKKVNEAIAETADAGAQQLKKGGPYEERSGKYTKDWDKKQRIKAATAITNTEEYSVYNKKHYQLTHLLEKGHQSRNGGRVKPYEHIAQTEKEMSEEVTRNIISKF